MPGDGSSIQCLIFQAGFFCWNSLYEPYIQPGILVQWTRRFLIVYALLIWQGFSCATPWKWNSLVHSTLFLSKWRKDSNCLSKLSFFRVEDCPFAGWHWIILSFLSWTVLWWVTMFQVQWLRLLSVYLLLVVKIVLEYSLGYYLDEWPVCELSQVDAYTWTRILPSCQHATLNMTNYNFAERCLYKWHRLTLRQVIAWTGIPSQITVDSKQTVNCKL